MDILLVQPQNSEKLRAVKAVLKALDVDFIVKKEKSYDPAFVKKIQESRKQAKDGKVTVIKPEDLWK